LLIYYFNSFSGIFLLLGNEKPIVFNKNKKFRIFLPGPSVTNFQCNSNLDEYTNIYVNNTFSLLKKFKTKNNFYFTSDIKRAEEFMENNTDPDIKSILYPVDFFQINRKIIRDFDHIILPNLSFFLNTD
jgi:hypothetical protein